MSLNNFVFFKILLYDGRMCEDFNFFIYIFGIEVFMMMMMMMIIIILHVGRNWAT